MGALYMKKYLLIFPLVFFYAVNVFALNSSQQAIKCPNTFPNATIGGVMPEAWPNYYVIFLNYNGIHPGNQVIVAKADNQNDAIARAKVIITYGLVSTSTNPQKGNDAAYCMYQRI